MSSIVWLVRHAQRLDFIQPEWFETSPYPYDPPLSARGWQQSLELVSLIKTDRIEKIFASPYLRALQTAYPLAQSLGLSIQIETGFREWLHPDWSSSLPATLTAEALDFQVPGINWGYMSQICPKYPETGAELASRTRAVADKLIVQSNQSVLIVAHKYALIGIIAALTGNSSIAHQLTIEPASVTVLTARMPVLGNWQLAENLTSSF